MKNYYIAIIMIAYIMIGCSKTGENSSEKVGFVVTPSKNDIYYKCGNKKANLDRDGKFSCDSFPVAFYMDGNEMGAITSIHNDGFVFPQDMQSFTIASR
jgi:hypothetical protein